MKLASTIVIAVAAVVLAGAALVAQSGSDLYGQALVKERTGSYSEAVAIYQTIVDKHASDRKLLAKALYQMGQAYEKLGKPADARKAYERIARDLSEQTAVATLARDRLASGVGGSTSDRAHRRICSDCGNAWDSMSADGRMLAFSRDGDLFVRDNTSGRVVPLLTDPSDETLFPLLSPDRKQIAYVRLSGDDHDLRLIANDAGATPRILNSNPEYYRVIPAAWAPDGKSVLAFIDKEVDRTWMFAWVSISNGTVTPLKSIGWRFDAFSLGRPTLSPDGRYVAYAALVNDRPRGGAPPTPESPYSDDSHIFVLALDGSTELELVRGASRNEAPIWSPDGKSLLFVSNRGGDWGLWSVAFQGGSLKKVDSISGRVAPLGMTSAGTYVYRLPPARTGESFVISSVGNAAGDGRHVSETVLGAGATWSPDGRLIAFTRETDLRSVGQTVRATALFTYSLDSKDETRYVLPVTPALVPRGYPLWLNDGKGLLIVTGGVLGTVYRVDLKSGTSTAVRAGLATHAPSADARTLYATARETGDYDPASGCEPRRIVAVDMMSGQLRPIATMLFPGSIIPTHDDRTIFVRVCTKVVERRGGGGTATHFQRVVAVDVGTGRQREVVAVPSPQSFESLAMTPDGRTLAAVVVDNRDEGDSRRRLVRFGMDGSNYRELYVTPTAQGRMDDLSWALGGSEIRWCEASSPTERCQYMKIDAGGGTPEVLPGLLSPDGSHAITVPRATATSSELWAIDSFLPKTAR